MADTAKREIVKYEYWFETTPRYKVANESWELHDVFLKHLDNGAFVFVPVFRRKIIFRSKPKGSD